MKLYYEFTIRIAHIRGGKTGEDGKRRSFFLFPFSKFQNRFFFLFPNSVDMTNGNDGIDDFDDDDV